MIHMVSEGLGETGVEKSRKGLFGDESKMTGRVDLQ